MLTPETTRHVPQAVSIEPSKGPQRGGAASPTLMASEERLSVSWGSATVELPADRIALAHFGCKLFGKLIEEDKEQKQPRFTPATKLAWTLKFGSEKAWSITKDATISLAEALRAAAVAADFGGLTPWDTMRLGSDYWRPGNGLSKVAERLAAGTPSVAVTFLKHDELCPSTELLSEFRESSQMSFAEYAQAYATYLRTPPLLERAAAAAAFELGLGRLPAFYCVDPHIPDYACPGEMLRLPYLERYWMDALRTEGCHRVILVEEILRVFVRLGLPVRLFEVNSTVCKINGKRQGGCV